MCFRQPTIAPKQLRAADAALRRAFIRRDSVLECGSPLPLSTVGPRAQSGRGLPHSKTSRGCGRLLRLVFSLLLFLGSNLSAVTYPLRWHWSNPLPHGGNVVDMAYSSSLFLGVQVAERGQIYTSDDLSLWLPRESHTTDSLRAVTFFGSRIVITGESGRVLYADDVSDFQFGTLVDGPTDDWLEAAMASASLVVAVGDFGALYTSPDGIIWKRQDSGTSEWLRGVSYGSGAFVAVGREGTILRSTNGTNWVAQVSGVTNHLNRVRYAANRFVAVGDAGVALISTNAGVTWYPENTGAANGLENTCAGGADQIVAGYHEVRLKDDSVWGDELAKTNGPPDWTYYSCIGQSGFFLIAGQSGMQSEGYQTNGTPYFWLTPYDSVRNWLWDVTYASFLYVTVGDFGTVMTSGNGVSWSLEVVPTQATNTTFLGVGGTTNLLLAVGDGGSMIASPNILSNIVVTNATGGAVTQSVSSLGVLWYPVPGVPTTFDLQGVAALSNSVYVVSGAYGTILTSVDGTNWTVRTTPTTKFLSGLTEWPGGLVASGDDGAIITSADGARWTLRASGTTNWLYRVRYLNGILVAVGQNGTLLTSTNGSDWTSRNSGTAYWLNDVTFVDDTWFVVGTFGTVLTSTNLNDWENRGTLTKNKSLYGVATDSKQLATVGVEGVILRSQIIPDLTPVQILAYSRLAETNGTTFENLFLFGGKTDQQFTLDRAGDVEPRIWSVGPPFEIFDPSGVLYYVETVSGTNQPETEFYRATLKAE